MSPVPLWRRSPIKAATAFLSGRASAPPLFLFSAIVFSGCLALNEVDTPVSGESPLSVAGVSYVSVSGPSSGIATYCSDAFIVTLEDSSRSIATTTEDLTITLSGEGAGAFYSDSACTTPISSLTVPTGSSLLTFYTNQPLSAALSVTLTIERLGQTSVAYTVNPNTYTVTLSSGEGQTGTVGSALAASLVALVKDAADNVVVGATLDWSSASGSLGSSSSTTDASGLASNTFTLPTSAGAKTITATVRTSGESASFSATAVAGAASAISVASGNNQSAGLSTALTDPLVVFVADAYGNAVNSATVNWTKSAGTLGSTSSTSDAAGSASTTFTLGASSGSHTITATLNGTSTSVSFTASASACVGTDATATTFTVGAGTSGSPYVICNATQYNLIAANSGYMSKAFLLDADIDMTGVTVQMIGSSANPFTGIFDGGSHTLSNVTITSSSDNSGLFGYAGTAFNIKNLRVSTISVTASGKDNVAAVLGYASSNGSGIIQNVSVTGATVTGRDNVGVILGTHDYWSGSMNITKTSAVSSTITGRSYVGGIAGNFMNGAFSKNMSRVNVSASSTYAGGLAGQWNGGGSFTDSYTTHDTTYGSVSGTGNVGGAIGYVNNAGVPLRIFSTIAVTSSGTKAGLMVGTGGSVTTGFWDTQNSGISTTGSGYGLTSAMIQDISPYIAQNYDFNATWAAPVSGATPTLQWMDSSYALPTVASLFGGGTGTSGDPYLISTTTHLKNMAYAVNMNTAVRTAYFKLSANLDMSGVIFGGIGTVTTPFAGSFNGNSKTISNLSITPTYGGSSAGLFSAVTGGTYTNLTLASPTITTSSVDNIGALIGYSTASTTVSGITMTGASITGRDNTGGIWGQYASCFNCGYTGSLTTIAVSGSTISGRDNTGGIVGSSINGSTFNIQTSKITSSSVSGRTSVGGIIGQQFSGTFRRNYAIANVTGSANQVGGLSGYWTGGGTYADSYAIYDGTYGTVTGVNYVGGIVGYVVNAADMNRVFAACPITATGVNKGGIAGSISGTSGKDCFWDTTVSGIAAGSGYGSGYDTATLQNTNVFVSQDFDFSSYWTVPASGAYPLLQWDNASYVSPTLASLLPNGSGTSIAPYEIADTTDLKNMILAVQLYSSARTAYYKLTSSLTMTGVPFAGIGSASTPFAGYFDGNSKTISNLTILAPKYAGMAGFFNSVNGGSIHDFTINNLTLSASTSSYVGGVIGYSIGSTTVSNVSINTATITGVSYVGGIWGKYSACFNCGNTGSLSGATVSNATVTGSTNYVGGLLGGDVSGSTFNASTSLVTASTITGGTDHVGGAFGQRYSGGTFTRIGVNADVTGTTQVGGVAGEWVGGGTFSNCYAVTDGSTYDTVTGTNQVGGVIGYVNNGATPTNLFAAIKVVGTSNNYGIIGSGAGGTGSDSYWDSDVATAVTGGWGTSKTTALAQTAATFAAWDVNTIWLAVDGSYPTLR